MSEKMIEIVKKIGAMQQIAAEISQLWEELDPEEFDLLCDDYPFHESFDEVVARMQIWSERYTITK